MTIKCTYCGFPMDTPQKAHDFIHQQGEALVAHRKAISELEAENAEVKRHYDTQFRTELRAEVEKLTRVALIGREVADSNGHIEAVAAIDEILSDSHPTRDGDMLEEVRPGKHQHVGPCRGPGK